MPKEPKAETENKFTALQREEKFKRYVGDGVYVDFDGYHIIMTCERDGVTQRIALEQGVQHELEKYRTWLYAFLEAHADELRGPAEKAVDREGEG